MPAGSYPPATGYPDPAAGYSSARTQVPWAGRAAPHRPRTRATDRQSTTQPRPECPAAGLMAAHRPPADRAPRTAARQPRPHRHTAARRRTPTRSRLHLRIAHRPAARTVRPAARRAVIRRPAALRAATRIQSGPLRAIPMPSQAATALAAATAARAATAAAVTAAHRRPPAPQPAAMIAPPRRQAADHAMETLRAYGDAPPSSSGLSGTGSSGACRRPLRPAQRPLLAAGRQLRAGRQRLWDAEHCACHGQQWLLAAGLELRPELPVGRVGRLRATRFRRARATRHRHIERLRLLDSASARAILLRAHSGSSRLFRST